MKMEKPNLASVSDIDTAMRVRNTTIEQIVKLRGLLELPFPETRRTTQDIRAGIAMLREQIRVIDKSVEEALDTLCNEGWPELSMQESIYDDDAVPRFIPHLMAGDHPLLG
jgi:hypothetical protein